MISLQNVDSFWDLIGLLIAVVGTVAVTVAPVLIKKQRDHNQEISQKLDAANDQLANGHVDPLRADIDKVLAAAAQINAIALAVDAFSIKVDGIGGLVREQAKDISGIREDFGDFRGQFRDAQRDQAEFESRVQKFVRAQHPGAGPV